MVKYKYIIEAIDDYTIKCSVTLKSVKAQIEPLVKQLARNTNEYEYMMENIPRFYRDTYKSDSTTIYCRSKDYNRNWLENPEEEHEEWESTMRGHWNSIPQKAKEVGERDGFQIIMTNKTDWHGGISYPDSNDLNRMGLYNSKFLVVCGDDGLTITRNDTPVVRGDVWRPDRFSNDFEFVDAITKITSHHRNIAEKNSANNGIDRIRQEYRNTRAGSKRDNEKREKIQKIVAQEWKAHSQEEIDFANNTLQSNGFDWTIHYVPIKKGKI